MSIFLSLFGRKSHPCESNKTYQALKRAEEKRIKRFETIYCDAWVAYKKGLMNYRMTVDIVKDRIIEDICRRLTNPNSFGTYTAGRHVLREKIFWMTVHDEELLTISSSKHVDEIAERIVYYFFRAGFDTETRRYGDSEGELGDAGTIKEIHISLKEQDREEP